MANALESASLIMVPSGYEDGTLGSLKPTDGTGDFTFSRGSDISATRVNADGYIEKGYENTIIGSNDFARDDSSYLITNGEAGYDGTNDAWLVNKLATGNAYFGKNSLVYTGVVTISFYAKAGTLDRIFLFTAGDAARFDLENVTATRAGGTPIAQTIELVSGTTDWYRCSITINKNETNNLLLKPQNASNQDAAGTIYIQDAMLNQGLVAYPYIETTTAPVAGGILEDMPRLDYSNGSCPALLLEPQRTNLIIDSEYFSNKVYNSTLITQNYATSPEGVVNSALIDKNGVLYGRIDYSINKPSGTYTYSAFVKGNDVVKLRLDYTGASKEAYINCSNGQTTNHPLYPMDSISSVDYGNGWYRFICTTAIPSGLILSFARLYPMDVVGGEGNTNPATAEIYGLQLEQDATYPTSYIPTYGVSQTRLREVVANQSIPNTPSLWSCLIDVDFSKTSLVSNKAFFNTITTTGAMSWRFFNKNGAQVISPYFEASASYAFDTNINNNRTDGRVLLRHNGGGSYTYFRSYLGVVTQTTATGLTETDLNQINFNGIDVKWASNQILVFPTALTDSECIELTTI